MVTNLIVPLLSGFTGKEATRMAELLGNYCPKMLAWRSLLNAVVAVPMDGLPGAILPPEDQCGPNPQLGPLGAVLELSPPALDEDPIRHVITYRQEVSLTRGSLSRNCCRVSVACKPQMQKSPQRPQVWLEIPKSSVFGSRSGTKADPNKVFQRAAYFHALGEYLRRGSHPSNNVSARLVKK